MRDDRGLSTVVGYVLSLSVMGILITGLLVAGGNFVDGQRQGTIHSQMKVVGQQVVSDLETADHLSRDGSGTTVELSRSYPDRMTGAAYTIAVEDVDATRQRLVLTTENPDMTVTVTFDTTHHVEVAGGGTIRGGDLTVEFEFNGTALVIDDA